MDTICELQLYSLALLRITASMFSFCELQPPTYQGLQVQAKSQNSDHLVVGILGLVVGVFCFWLVVVNFDTLVVAIRKKNNDVIRKLFFVL